MGCCLWGRTESDGTEATEQQPSELRMSFTSSSSFFFFFFNFRALHFLIAEENRYFLTGKLCEIQFLVSLKLKQGLASSFGYCLWLKTSSIAKDHIRKA